MNTTIIEPKIEKEELTSNYGKFIIEPLERGYGVTIGNSVRRILLSSISGFAVTSVKIDGILHEFSTIPGVVEDVVEIILNIKGVRFKLKGSEEETMILDVSGSGEVKASSIKSNPNVEIMNPDWYIATITDKKARLYVEMKVEKGRGYVAAENLVVEETEIGVIPVDAIFSPVQRVNYVVEDTRVGQATNYNKLLLEVWTDGSITPENAISQAAKILRRQFEYFELIGQEQEFNAEELKSLDKESILDLPITKFEFSVRTMKCLTKTDIKTVKDLSSHTREDLMNIKNFGKGCLQEIEEKLKELDLSLAET